MIAHSENKVVHLGFKNTRKNKFTSESTAELEEQLSTNLNSDRTHREQIKGRVLESTAQNHNFLMPNINSVQFLSPLLEQKKNEK